MKPTRRSSAGRRGRRRAPTLLLAAAIIPAFVIYLLMLRSQPPTSTGGASLEGLIDQRGQTIGRETFRDRYKLLAFGYTRCPEACPATLMKMRVVLSGLGSAASTVTPLFVTVDPEHDTPSILGEYAAGFDPRIIAISGDRGRLERYARAYGALPPPESEARRAESATHTVRIYLLAPDDSVVATYELADPTPLVVTDVERRMAAAATGPGDPRTRTARGCPRMTTRRLTHRICRDHRWVVLAIAIGFLTRALIPAGFMPRPGGLTFCFGGTSTPMVGTLSHVPEQRHDGNGAPSESTGHGDGCVFAGSATGLVPRSVAVVAAVPPIATVTFEVPTSAVSSSSPFHRAQSPRGPPGLS